MAISKDLFLAPILNGEVIPEDTRIYFRARFRSTLHQFLLEQLEERQRQEQLTRTEIARRIDREPSQVTRWLAAPTNLTLDTISDLLLAMGAEPDFFARRLDAIHSDIEAAETTNECHATGLSVAPYSARSGGVLPSLVHRAIAACRARLKRRDQARH